MLTEVSFTATFAVDITPELVAYHVAHWVTIRLIERGHSCSDLENIDYGYAFRCRVGSRDFYLIVGYVGDHEQEWIIIIHNGLSFLQRLFRQQSLHEYRQLTQDLHAILTAEAKTSNIRWYVGEGARQNSSDDWTSSPSL